MSAPLTPQREAEIRAIAARAVDSPFFLSDCEGELQVWRESALTHVTRDESGEIDGYSFPSSYRSTDQVIEIDLDSWDPGEDATDDQRRQDIGDLVAARAALTDVVAELDAARAELTTVRADALTNFAASLTRKAEAMGAAYFRVDQVCEALNRVAADPAPVQPTTGGAS